MKKFIKEFKAFTLKGNVMDLAVAVLIGAAFQGVVTSLTTNIISPIIGIFGKANLDIYSVTVNGSKITYGAFITAVINFIIMALVIFILVKMISNASNFRKNPQEKAITTKKCPYCCTEIDIKAVRCPNCTSVLEENIV